MKNPKEMRARAERYRGHAQALSDPKVREVIRSVADNLEHEADRIEHEQDQEKQRRAESKRQV